MALRNESETEVTTDVESALDNSTHDKTLGSVETQKNTAAELKKNFHGDIYQLKLLLLCLWRGMKKERNFGLITETMEAGKFDDAVLPYISDKGIKSIQFVQAKHSQKSVPLRYTELTDTNDGHFSLIKYFKSFRQIENNKINFADFEKEYYILITNRGIENIEGILKPACIKKLFFYANEDEFKGFKINIDQTHEIFKLLIKQDELKMLADAIWSNISKEPPKKFTLENYSLSVYHEALMQNMVLEKNTDDFHFEFHSEFIDNKNLVPQVLRLRSMLVEKFKNSLKKENKKNILMEKEISKGFGAQFNDRKMTPAEKEENAKALASALAKTLNNEEHTSVDNGFIKLSEIIDNLNRFKKYKEIFCKTLLKEYNYETEIRELLKRNFEKTPYFGEHFTKPEAPTEITCLCTLLIKIIKSDADKPKKNLNDVDAQKMKSLAGHVLVYHKNENCLIFSEAFFNDKIPESYKTFKKMLMEEMEKNALNYDYLRLIKFKLKTPTFQSCFEDRNVETELPLDSDNIEEKVSKFLKHFILVISPHETELSNLIKKEVSVAPNINLLDADFATNHTLVEVLDWMKAESSILFSKDKAEIIFKSLNSKISALMLAGNNSEYCKKLREYFPISANFMVNSEINSVFQNSMKSKIKNFLNSTSYILFLTSEGPICTLAIKVEQSLREIGSELINGYSLTSKDSFVFNPLSRILRMEEDVINILNRPKQKTLLIIVCYEDSKTCDSIIDKVNEDNKIIFIGSKNSKIFQTLEVRPQNFETDNDSNNDFSSLTEKAQKYLLNKNVKFYDEIVSLEQVFDLQAAKGLVDAILFEKLVLNDEVKLIEKKENCFDRHDIDYYVSRGFYQCTEFTESVIDYIKNVPTDAIVIEQYESNDTIFKNISIVNYNEAEVKYNELCKKYNNVHWLKKEFNKFFWIKSHGSIAKLVMHQVHSESESNEHDNARIYSKNEILQFVEGNKILILSNVAGMGKSIITSKMACFFQNMNAAFIVVKISFTDHRPILQRIKFDDNEQLVLNLENMDDEILKKGKELIHLLFCLKNETLKKQGFEEKLFQYYFKNGRMIIMFDGFDEIMENMKVIVLKFISKLKSSTKHKIWITSRVAFKETLETTFDAFSFTLKPFDDKDQTKFLKKYWTSKYSKINDNKTALTAEIEEKIRIYAAKFLDLYKDSIQEKNRNFIGIPLQLEMLAEIYKRKEKKDDKWEGCFDYIENAIDDSPTLPPIINLFQLYEKFVEIKIKDKYYYGKTRTQRGDPILDPMFKSRFEDALNYHQLFALALLVSDESLKQILLHSKQDELKGWTDKMKSGEENAGIIIKIVDGKPHFIHLTFAEYFAALYLTKNCVKASEFPDFFKYVNNICTNCSSAFIFFIDHLLKTDKQYEDLLQKKNLLTYSAENGYSNIVKLFIKENIIPDCDDYGKTALHYAALKNEKEILNFLLTFYDDIKKKNILRNGKFKKSEYASSKLVTYVNVKDHAQKTALYYAIQNENWDIAEQLALKGDYEDSLGEENTNFSRHVMFKITTLHTSDKYWNISKPLFIEKDTCYPPFEEIQKYYFNTYSTEKHYLYPIVENVIQNFDVNELPSSEFIRLMAILWHCGRLQLIKDIKTKVDNNEEKKRDIFKAEDREQYPLDVINVSPYINDDERLELIKYLFEHDGTSISSLSSAHRMPKEPSNPDFEALLKSALDNGLLPEDRLKGIDNETRMTLTKILYRQDLLKPILKNPENLHFITLLNAAVEYGAVKTFKHYFHEKKYLADHFLNLAFYYDQQEIIKYLLSSDNGNQGIDHNTLLHIAMLTESVSVKQFDEIYEDTKDDLNIENKKGETHLILAINATHGLSKIKHLVEKDENVITQRKKLILTMLNSNFVEEDIFKYLLKKLGYNLNQSLHQVMKAEIEAWKKSEKSQKQKLERLLLRLKKDAESENLRAEKVENLNNEDLREENVENSNDEDLREKNVENLNNEKNVENSNNENLHEENVENSNNENLHEKNVENLNNENLREENVENLNNEKNVENLNNEDLREENVENLNDEDLREKNVENLNNEKNVENSNNENLHEENVENSNNENLHEENVENLNNENLHEENVENLNNENLHEENVENLNNLSDEDVESFAEKQMPINQALMIYLIKHGADVSERDDANKIPLHYACEEKLDQVINVLLQHGSKFEDDGVTYSESVEEIFKNPESFSGVFQVEFINAKNDDEKTLLHIALENSSEKALKDVLDAHRDHLKSRKRGTREYKSYSFTSLNAKDKEGKTPLMIAIEKRNSLAVQELIKCGVIFDTENLNSSEENIAQQIDNVKKIFDNFEKTTEIFEIQNDFKDVRNAQGETPLHFAVKFKNYSMLTKLIKMEAYMEAENNDHKTPLYFAAESDDIEAVNILLLHGAILNTHTIFYNQINDSKRFLNEIANVFGIIKGKCPEDIVDALNERSDKEVLIMVNTRDEHGYILLHYAALWNYFDIIKNLLNKGAVLNTEAKDDDTAESFDANKEMFKKISKLFEDLETIDEKVKVLQTEYNLEETLIVNIRKDMVFGGILYKGSTLLHAAVHYKQIFVIKWLLTHGANVNAKDLCGNTIKQLKSYHEDFEVKACIDGFSKNTQDLA